MRSATLLSLVLVVAGCSTLTPADDPVYLRVTDLDARLIRIERLFENESLIQLATQVDQLRAETQSLRGEIETLRFETAGAAERQRDLYIDVDQRLQSIEQAQAARSVAPAAGGAFAPAASGDDQASYDAAFALVQSRRYEEAAAAFTSFMVNFPDSRLSDNAQYWYAETQYVQQEFTAALAEFQKVLDDYPQSAKLPDALLKVGYCNFELRRFDAARTALQEVARLYPETTAARLAEQRLERIAQEAG